MTFDGFETSLWVNTRGDTDIHLLPKNHYHNAYEVYYLTGSNCTYLIGDHIYNLKSHDIILIPPNTVHRAMYNSYASSRRLINFKKNYLAPELVPHINKLFSSHIFRPDENDIPVIDSLFDKLEAEYVQKSALSQELCRCCVTELLAFMIRHISEKKSSQAADSPENEFINRTLEYIGNHYCEPLTLSELAKNAGYSDTYFSKLFKRVTGFNFKEYILMLRIKRSKELLCESQKTISHISTECGFNDSNYFSTVFKEHEGISPKNFKKMLK